MSNMTFSLFALLIIGGSAFLAPKTSKGTKKAGFHCYEGSGESAGDPMLCKGEGEDTCVIRWKASGGGDISRYCTTAATCPNTGGFTEVVSGESYIVRCCQGDSCNAGKPTSLSAGLYWIKGDGKYATLTKDGLKMEDFGMGPQTFQVTPGDALKGEHSITAIGGTSDIKYIVTSVGEGEYDIQYSPVAGAPAVKLYKLKSGAFGIVKTTDWEVASFELACPSESVKPVTASDPESCKMACLADSGCAVEQKFEWTGTECKLLIKPCTETEKGDATLVTYKSKCAGVTCSALSTCHRAGVCSLETGQCSNPILNDGSGCDDGDETTMHDVCTAGQCAGINLCAGKETCPITAMEAECHVPGTCDYATGACGVVPKAGGTPCNDNNPLTVSDVCNAGICAGTDLCAAKECPAPHQCSMAGVCNHLDGKCEYQFKANGAPCDDGEAKTIDDVCTAGVCAGRSRCADVECQPPASACYKQGTCDEMTGECVYDFQPSAHACDDGSDLTVDDKCDGAGSCFGTNKCLLLSCPVADASKCEASYQCDHSKGECFLTKAEDGASCDDEDPKTSEDKCQLGKCEGVDKCATMTCEPTNQCHTVACELGTCIQTKKDKDTVCDDGDENTEEDLCGEFAVCAGKPKVVPPAPVVQLEESVPEPVIQAIETNAQDAVAAGEEIFEDAASTENAAKADESAQAEVVTEAKAEEEVIQEEVAAVEAQVNEANDALAEAKVVESAAESTPPAAAPADLVPADPVPAPEEAAAAVEEQEADVAELKEELVELKKEETTAEQKVLTETQALEPLVEAASDAETAVQESAPEAPVAAAATGAAEAVVDVAVSEATQTEATKAVEKEVEKVAEPAAEEVAKSPEVEATVDDVIVQESQEAVQAALPQVAAAVTTHAVKEAEKVVTEEEEAPKDEPPPAPQPEEELAMTAAAEAVINDEVFEPAAATVEEEVSKEVEPKVDDMVKKDAEESIVDEVPAQADPVVQEVTESVAAPAAEPAAEEVAVEAAVPPVEAEAVAQAQEESADAVSDTVEDAVATQPTIVDPPPPDRKSVV